MPSTTVEKLSSANLTVKLDGSERDRLKSLAIAKKRTPHYLMKEAIQKYLEVEEAEQRFIQIGRESLANYRKTGLHITLDEFGEWVDALKKNPKATIPVCHK
jgi:predicted transcriptional regulator